jgi:hypothetical protein
MWVESPKLNIDIKQSTIGVVDNRKDKVGVGKQIERQVGT